MATLKNNTTTERFGMCPNCLGIVALYARLDGLDRWTIEEKCPCGYAIKLSEWPFVEENTIVDVPPGEIIKHGIRLRHPSEAKEAWHNAISTVSTVAGYEYQYENDEQYGHDVDHGWEDTWYASFYG